MELDSEILRDWEDHFQTTYIKSKQLVKDLNDKRMSLQKEFHDKLSKEELLFERQREDLLRSSPLLIINGITVQSLPHSLIESTLSMGSKDRQTKLEIILQEYKVSLYNRYKNNELSVDDLFELVRKG